MLSFFFSTLLFYTLISCEPF